MILEAKFRQAVRRLEVGASSSCLPPPFGFYQSQKPVRWPASSYFAKFPRKEVSFGPL
jgi:hypothetical protein